MFLLTAAIVISTVIFCLALAASSSGVSSVSLLDPRDKPVAPEAMASLQVAPKPFRTTHHGIDTQNAPIVSAAGLQ